MSGATPGAPRCCCVLACDGAFFFQAEAAIDTLAAVRAATGIAADIRFVDLGIDGDARAWLGTRGVGIVEPDPGVPRFRGAPPHTYAMTCRPFLPRSLPGYDVYLWVDADIRFLRSEGLAFYLRHALRDGVAAVIAQESDPAYNIISDARVAALWQSDRRLRLARAFPPEIATAQTDMPSYNAGLFAAAAGSPIWEAYRRRLEEMLALPFERLREQDAMNVALREVPKLVRAPTTMNWLCSLALPWRAPDGTWRHPDHRNEPIAVAHLTRSDAVYTAHGRTERYYDFYRRIGLTA